MEFNKLHQLFIDLNGTRMISSVFEGSTNKLTENLGSISKYLKVDKCKMTSRMKLIFKTTVSTNISDSGRHMITLVDFFKNRNISFKG